MRTPYRIVPGLAALFLSLALAPAAGAASPAEPRIERIAQVGRLWGFVRYLHPYLAYRDVDWDAALVRALPAVADAQSPESYAATVQTMLDALGDPVTRVLPPEKTTPPPAPAPADGTKPTVVRTLEGGAVLYDVGAVDKLGIEEVFAGFGPMTRTLAEAPSVIVDLRGATETSGFYVRYVLDEVQGFLVRAPARAPTERYLLHSGYRPQDGSTSGSYWSGFVSLAANTFAPATGSPTTPRRVVFLVGPETLLPPLALALQASGTASLVTVGPLREERAVTSRVLELGDGVRVRVRVSEILPLPGWAGLHADVEVPAGQDEATLLATALAEARRPPAPPEASAPLPALPEAVFRPDATYPEMLEPDLAHRRLAVIRAWNVIHFFYPYLHLLDDWDAVLPEFLARMETVASGQDYALTIQEMMARVADGHTSVAGHPALLAFFGDAGLPLEIRWVEGAAVVTGALHEAARAAGIQVGDAVLAVDGEPAAARMERFRKYTTGSTDAFVQQRLCRSLTRGAAGTTAVLSLQGVDGLVREARLERKRRPAAPPADLGATVRVLPGNIGYMDLTRLELPEVPAAFETVKDTRGLVLDMRGYPNGTAWAIAPRINTRGARVGAQFRRSQVMALSAEEGEAGFYFAQPLPPLPPGAALYTRPTVMLIDDRAISQSEHSGLFFEAAAGTRFIGTPTAGANGDVTNFSLPGGLSVYFTGHDVRHADGGRLQRKGLTPHVEIAPTRAGLHAGKDEVLDRALEDLQQTPAREAGTQETPTP